MRGPPVRAVVVGDVHVVRAVGASAARYEKPARVQAQTDARAGARLALVAKARGDIMRRRPAMATIATGDDGISADAVAATLWGVQSHREHDRDAISQHGGGGVASI